MYLKNIEIIVWRLYVAEIKLLILDVDGVLTDGRIYLSAEGEETKAFHIKDGTGIKQAQQAGIKVAFVTGRYCNAVSRRAEELKIADVYQNVADKAEIYRELKQKYGLDDSEICYVGDDIQDLEPIKMAGLGVAVADAVDEIKQAADLITTTSGGRGAVRELISCILSGSCKTETG